LRSSPATAAQQLHFPSKHALSQHSALDAQVSPIDLHAVQTFFDDPSHLVPEQQSLCSAHTAPATAHPQIPSLQECSQQSLLAEQTLPAGEQQTSAETAAILERGQS